jgi:hypothetical protein
MPGRKWIFVVLDVTASTNVVILLRSHDFKPDNRVYFLALFKYYG